MAATLPGRIAVLLHARDSGAERRLYQIWDIVEVWREWGIEVLVVRGTSRAVHADIVINHVDLTVVPDDYVRFLARYPVAINGRCTDISKRAISSNLLTKDDAWPGPFIVKTDRNHGGRQERRLKWGRVGLLAPDAWWPSGRWDTRSMLDPNAYPIFERAADVPRGVWHNPRLVVERFLPERDGKLFRIRSMEFFGDRWVNRLRWSPSPIVKAKVVVRSEDVEPHPDVFDVARQLNLDRGKIDYVIHDGHPLILDANRTNTVASYTRQNRAATARQFAEALWQFWPPPSAERG